MKIARGYALVLGAALAACAPQPSGEPAPATTTEAPAFHFQSGDLPLGEFDPHTIGDNLFDPCSEISDAEFAEAGFSGKNDLGFDSFRQLGGCYFNTENPDIAIGFVSNAANRDIVTSQEEPIPEIGSASVPGVYFARTRSGETDCYAAVDTVRGGFGVNVVSLDPTISLQESCDLARSGLEALYQLRRE